MHQDKVQQKLKNWGYYKGKVDGIFGAQTKEAVKYFQRKKNFYPKKRIFFQVQHYKYSIEEKFFGG